MTRSLGPLSISIWDGPGLLVEGFDTPPTIMLGHNSALYRPWVEGAGYRPVKTLLNYKVPIVDGFPPIVNRLVAAGEKTERIRRSEEDTSELQSLMRISYAVFCLNIKNKQSQPMSDPP